MLRILHVGLGPLGQKLAVDLGERGLGEIVAAVDVAPSLVGKPLAEIVPGASADVRISAELPGLGPEDLDCAVVATSSDLALCAPIFRELLARGLAVVTTCEECLWPTLRHAELAEELDGIARAAGGRLLGTGVNPGFLMDTLPAVLSTLCRKVDAVEVWRIQDASSRRIPFQKKIGAGLDEEAFAARIADGSLRHVGLGESLFFTAHALDLEIASWEESIEAVPAERELECGLGRIEVGQAAGVRQVATAVDSGGGVVARLEFQAAIGQADPHDRVRVEGEPLLDVVVQGGVHGDIATCAVTLNSIPSLLAAPPGLHTMASMPLVHLAPTRG